MEHIIHSNITDHVERRIILSDHQHRIRKRRSCETQLVQAVEDLACEVPQRRWPDRRCAAGPLKGV